MMRTVTVAALAMLASTSLSAQDDAPAPPAESRGWFSRVFHRSNSPPNYKDPRLKGLTLELELSPLPVKLGEVRQLHINATLTNRGRRPVSLDFMTAQRIEIQLVNAAGEVLTKFSENHAFAEELTTVLINPQERVQYVETIATRELEPNKVYTAEVFFPAYPELRVQQKFLTAP